MLDPLIWDNLIPETLQQQILSSATGGAWQWSPHLLIQQPGEIVPPILYFTRLLSATENSIVELTDRVSQAAGRRFLCVNSKFNLQIAMAPHQTTSGKPHRDGGDPEWVCIYYVTGGEGDTRLLQSEEGSITHSIEPRQGRVVLFSGSLWHSAGRPTHGHRCILNLHMAEQRQE
jgi:hypothetical protein